MMGIPLHSHPPGTLVPGALASAHIAHTRLTHIHAGKTPKCIKLKNNNIVTGGQGSSIGNLGRNQVLIGRIKVIHILMLGTGICIYASLLGGRVLVHHNQCQIKYCTY